MQISERLRQIASLVTEGSRVADIGTDHAYVPIYLVKEGRAVRVLAMDVREGPLARAREHIREQGLSGCIEVRLSDGLSAYRRGEADSIVITGMGGELMVRILSGGAGKYEGVRELILSPQSEPFLVRRWLRENGFLTEREVMLCEDGKYYTIMRAAPGIAESSGPAEDRYGKFLLENKDPVLKEYLLRESETVHKILASLEVIQKNGTKEPDSTGGRERTESRKKELSDRLFLIKEALSYYEM